MHCSYTHALLSQQVLPRLHARCQPLLLYHSDGVQCSLTNFKILTAFQLCCSLFIRRKPVLQVQVQIYHCCNREPFTCDNSALVLSCLFFPVSLSPLSPNYPCPVLPPHYCRVELCWTPSGSRLAQRQDHKNTQSHLLIPPEIFSSFFLGDKLSKDLKWTLNPVYSFCVLLWKHGKTTKFEVWKQSYKPGGGFPHVSLVLLKLLSCHCCCSGVLGFSEAPRGHFNCNRCHINKDLFESEEESN